jgi:secernin
MSYLEDLPMECDAVVALARATVDGQTLFGRKSRSPSGHFAPLCRVPGRACAPDEKLRTEYLELPQARQTYSVLGCQPEESWGYEHGFNEHQVAVGCMSLMPKLRCDGPGLSGTDIARLALERSRTARQAVDLLTSLVERYGQGAFPGCPADAEHDNAFLIVDPTEAYAVETSGHHWVYQEVQEVRAVSNVRVIRQDWDRISQGLASYAIGQGWWADDGSKLDFAGALGQSLGAHGSAMRRWGRNTLRLMEQNGQIDTALIRHLLSEELEEAPRRSDSRAQGDGEVHWRQSRRDDAIQANAAGFVVSLTSAPERLAVAWYAFGLPRTSLYFPVFLDGELPETFTPGQPASSDNFWRRMSRLSDQLERNPERRELVRDSFARLQARFDQEAEEFNAEGAALKQRGAHSDLHRLATLFMQYNLERFETVLADALRTRPMVAVDN